MRPMLDEFTIKRRTPRNRTNVVRLENTINKLYRKGSIAQARRRRRFIRHATSVIIPNKRSLFIMIIRDPRTRRLRKLKRMSVPPINVLSVSEHYRRTLTRRGLVFRLPNVKIVQMIRNRQPRMTNIFRHNLRGFTMRMKRRNMTRASRVTRDKRRLKRTMMFLRPNTRHKIITRRQNRRARLGPTRNGVQHNVKKRTTRINATMRRATRLSAKRRLSINRRLNPTKVIITRPSTTMTITTGRTKTTMGRNTLT